MTHKHEKVTQYIKMPDGSIKITSKSYYEELANMIEEIEKPHHNLSDSTAKEVVDKALERITSDSSVKTIITITKAKNGGYKILERYTNIRENY